MELFRYVPCMFCTCIIMDKGEEENLRSYPPLALFSFTNFTGFQADPASIICQSPVQSQASPPAHTYRRPISSSHSDQQIQFLSKNCETNVRRSARHGTAPFMQYYIKSKITYYNNIAFMRQSN
eukprot:scpid108420/ scgid6402/ 